MRKLNHFVCALSVLLVGTCSMLLAQDQITLNDGLANSFFFGGGSNQIRMTLPTMNCSAGTCVLAAAGATGTGDLAGSGTYSITAPGTIPVQGGFAGPFSLTVQADGSSVVVQTAPITFTYTSSQGTLTALLTFTTVSKTTGFNSTMMGTLQATGGTFAQFFPSGGAISVDLGLPQFPLQNFPMVQHVFDQVEFQSGTVIANASCQAPAQLRRYDQGLPRVFSPDFAAFFSQTNNPSQIPCTTTSPCGSIDVAQGSGSFNGDLVVTVQLSGSAQPFQIDRMGFSSDIHSGFSLACFNFGSDCSAGIGGASLGGAMNEDGFGRFQNTLYTGLNGGSGCSPDGTGCQNLFTFVIGNSNGPLQTSDFTSYVAAHVANGVCSGYIATPRN